MTPRRQQRPKGQLAKAKQAKQPLARSRRPRRRRRAAITQNNLMMLSEPGLSFLKCAFASPDSNTDPGKGIPDNFEGKVLSQKNVYTETGVNFSGATTQNVDTYIIVLPTPGVAFWRCIKTATAPAQPAALTTTDVFTAVPFPDFTSLFGTTATNRADQVAAFRYASMNFGLYPTCNSTQYNGGISVWKGAVQMSTTQYPLDTTPESSQLVHAITGLESALKVGDENYSESFIDGVFTQSINGNAEFPFYPILEGVQTLPGQNVTVAQAGMPFSLDAGAATVAGFTGIGGMDAIFIKVTAAAGSVNTATIKTWACIEYRPNTNTALYKYAHDSPAEDIIALQQYRKVYKSLPVAVRAKLNANMWERVKRLLKAGLVAASYVPGPVGGIATGVQHIGDLIAELSF
ncbi:hypothetical protein BoVs2gp1 [Boolarra virus]|uniref:Capsid protein alpha n=1 Tax=Boolarra virus TaxID=12286 RepID=CAPSD_BOOLV|nr:hypothetical protein BoVs2gp1 [Boolarra virus]P12869.1 RecName: Full=Capsid protein alpha; Contains: RecName: Full=Capsid protein beta; AltName: Full=Coat protein beta; AltName: Full=Nodavirus endopeptidase; Contains: RecName: Full=Membrane-lytic peptide gamma; AltName: Full=Coat protein gamma [Boolarra virus]CAA34082.1 unnamed protein product [Boolarra virus]